MLIRSLSLIFFIMLALISCARQPLQNPPVLMPVKKISQTHSVPTFNYAIAEGRINVNLHTGYSQPKIILYGDPRDIAHVIVFVKNDTLLVSLASDYPKFGAVSVEIRGHHLRAFTYRGAGMVTGQHINSSMLDVSITNPGRTLLAGNIGLRKLEVKGSGYIEIKGIKTQYLQLIMTGNARVQLIGMINMSTINLNGSGRLGMYWVTSDTLTVRARGNTMIQLAGIANKLDLELWDYAHFNGRYLRAARTFAKTHGRSIADITTLDRQHTLATDASDIYFYKIPEMKTDFMAYCGSVLDMRDLSMPFIAEYNQYNK